MGTNTVMRNYQKQIIPLLKKYKVKRASLFGSYARGNNDKNSDIDILIEPSEEMGISIVHLRRELEHILDKKVDLVSFGGISRYLKDSILANQKIIL